MFFSCQINKKTLPHAPPCEGGKHNVLGMRLVLVCCFVGTRHAESASTLLFGHGMPCPYHALAYSQVFRFKPTASS